MIGGSVWNLSVRVVVGVMLIAGLMAAILAPQPTVAAQWKDTPTEEPEQSADPEELGMTGRRSYESPQFGYTIEWSRDWAVDEYYDEPLISDTRREEDKIYLTWTGTGRNEFAYLIVTGQTLSRGGVKEDVEAWTDPDFAEDNWTDPDLEVEAILDESDRRTGAVLFLLIDTETGDEFLLIYQAIELRDGTMIYLSFLAAEGVFEAAWEGAAGLEVNGEPVLQFLDWDDIEDALDAA